MILLKFQTGEAVGWGIQFRIQGISTRHTFGGTRSTENEKYMKKHDDDRKMKNTWKNVMMMSSSHFFMYFSFSVERVPPKVCRVGTPWMRNWILHPTASPTRHLSKTTWRYVENTSWKSSFSLFNYFLSFYIFTQFFYRFTLNNGDSSPMVDIMNLNPIGSYKVDFCCTFSFWGSFFTSKFL